MCKIFVFQAPGIRCIYTRQYHVIVSPKNFQKRCAHCRENKREERKFLWNINEPISCSIFVLPPWNIQKLISQPTVIYIQKPEIDTLDFPIPVYGPKWKFQQLLSRAYFPSLLLTPNGTSSAETGVCETRTSFTLPHSPSLCALLNLKPLPKKSHRHASPRLRQTRKPRWLLNAAYHWGSC